MLIWNISLLYVIKSILKLDYIKYRETMNHMMSHLKLPALKIKYQETFNKGDANELTGVNWLKPKLSNNLSGLIFFVNLSLLDTIKITVDTIGGTLEIFCNYKSHHLKVQISLSEKNTCIYFFHRSLFFLAINIISTSK